LGPTYGNSANIGFGALVLRMQHAQNAAIYEVNLGLGGVFPYAQVSFGWRFF